MTFGADATSPQWAPGNRIVFLSRGSGNTGDLAIVSADGGGTVRVLAKQCFDPSLSPDGRWLLFNRAGDRGGADVLRLGLDPNAMAPAPGAVETPVLNGPSNERAAKVHPSGRFIAYESEESGRLELYVTTFPDAQGKWQVSTGGIDFSAWHPDGIRLLYVRGNRLFEVAMTLGPTVTLGTPRMVFEEGQSAVILGQGVDVMPKGNAFVAVRRSQGESESLGLVSVVEHWSVMRPATRILDSLRSRITD